MNCRTNVILSANVILTAALRLTLVVAVFASIAPALASADISVRRPLEFVHTLQDNGYGDVAVDYLTMLGQQSGLPPELRNVWDLEMAKSLNLAAATAFDAKESQALRDAARQHLAKFIKEKPDHPEAVVAMISWAEFLMKGALDVVQSARSVGHEDTQQYEKGLSDARATLSEADNRLREAQKMLKAQFAALPPPSKLPTKKADRAEVAEARERAEAYFHQTQLQIALIDYYRAQTYSDPKSAERTAALTKAAQALDDIYQRNRGSIVALYAHMWHGKAVDELGDSSTSLDIFDEVLANAPEPGDRTAASGLEPLFAQAARFRLTIVARETPQQFLPEATGWLKEFRRFKETEGYQGIALDVATAMLAKVRKAPGPERTKLLGEALQIVTEGAKVRSPYQQNLALKRQEVLRLSGREQEANNFQEAVALGDAAAASSDWPWALKHYDKALALAETTSLTNLDAIAAVREAKVRVEFMIARDLFNDGKWNDCAELVARIIRDDDGHIRRQSAAAAEASALGVAAALNLYAEAPDDQKPAALEKLAHAAELTEQSWPDRPEADDARMARGQAKLLGGLLAEAIAIFERVNPKSERYATAMYMAGQSYWQLYVKAKQDGGTASEDAAKVTAYRDKAVACLQTALKILKQHSQHGTPLPRYMLETQLLLAEIHFRSGQIPEAAALYQTLIDAVGAETPGAFDANTVRIFLGALRAYCALEELDKARQIGGVLIERGPDTPQVNEVLVEFAKLLNLDRKKADARVTELEGVGDTETLKAAKSRLASVQEVLGQTLMGLSRRRELGVAQMIFVGEALSNVGMTAEATRQFQAFLDRTQTDAEFAKRAEKAMSRVRTDLLKVLRKEEKFSEALKQVERLIGDNPRAIEPLMEKGRILEAWAEKDPAKFDQAGSHWAAVRARLQGARKKPAEYYEAMYHVAYCLIRQEITGIKVLTLHHDISTTTGEEVILFTLAESPMLRNAKKK